jgi:nitrate reductase NapE component
VQPGWVRRVLLVTLFGVAFGYVEAALVVYLRVIYDPVRASLHPEQPPDSLLPLVTLQELRAEDPEHVTRLAIELGRELATLVMLVVAAALARRRRGEWIAFFMIVFGVWDIAYYLGLKAMIGFPQSLLTWDILFLIPLPWLGPVLAPVVVSLTMIGAGCVMLHETEHARPLQARWYHWTGIVAGGLIIIWSFCKDYEQTMAGEMPDAYAWPLFALGEIIGMTAFAHALRQKRLACQP